MSIRAYQWAMKQTCGSASAKCLLLVLADLHRDGGGPLFYGQERLAELAEMTPRTAFKHLKGLEDRGHIRRHARRDAKGHRASDIIELCLPDPNSQELQSGAVPTRNFGQSQLEESATYPGMVYPGGGGSAPARAYAARPPYDPERPVSPVEYFTAEEIALAKEYHAKVVALWGEDPARPAPPDQYRTWARAYLATGLPRATLREVFKEVLEGKAAQAIDNGPPSTMRYVEKAVYRRSEEMRAAASGEVVPITAARRNGAKKPSPHETLTGGFAAELERRNREEALETGAGR